MSRIKEDSRNEIEAFCTIGKWRACTFFIGTRVFLVFGKKMVLHGCEKLLKMKSERMTEVKSSTSLSP